MKSATQAALRITRMGFIPLLLAGLIAAAAVPNDGSDDVEVVYYDGLDEEGRLTGGFVLLPVPPRSEISTDSASTTIISNGPSANRIDLVCVGDGYLESELPAYALHVDDALVDLFALEPFITYATFFNVHRVDVISPESGVDHDPTYPTWRNTALHMGFWCGGTERLLCVDVTEAWSHANSAPDVDQIFAVANSSKYGGAGYTSSELATFAGANGVAPQIAIHELGHSLGDLADEYDYGGGSNWTGGEVPERNVSILNAAAMASAQQKWYKWLGENNPAYDGMVDCYEGARYYQTGIFRPTSNSMMRALGRPFNLPSIESLVIEMYKIVRPIDDSTPESQVLRGDETVFVTPVQPVGHSLKNRWFVDGVAVAGETGPTLDLASLALTPGPHTLKVKVWDPTTFVRDQAARNQWMTETRQWQMEVPGEAADITAWSLNTGTHLAGGLPQLRESDDRRLKVRSKFTGGNPPYLTFTEITLDSDLVNPSTLDLAIESRITRNTGIARVYLRNWNTGKWVLVKEYPIGKAEQVKRALGLNANQFVRASGMIKLRIRHEMTVESFDSHIDQVRVIVR